MHIIFQIYFAFAAVYSFTTAFSIENGRTFSLVQKLNPAFVRNAPPAYARGLWNSKYNKPLPYNSAGATGTVPATVRDPYEAQYLCAVDIDGQTLDLIFDTGSSDL